MAIYQLFVVGIEKNKDKKMEIEYKYAIDNKALYWNACYGQIRMAKKYYLKIKNGNYR